MWSRLSEREFALFALALFAAFVIATQARAEGAEPLRSSLFLGPRADHFLDRSGALTIDAVTSEAQGVSFIPAAERGANYGVQPTAALWLRVAIPKLDTDVADRWVVILNEPRALDVALFVPSAEGWSVQEWRAGSRRPGEMTPLRYPAYTVAGHAISERTIFMRIRAGSSMRAVLWLQTERSFITEYSTESTLFGVLFGVLGGLSIYLIAIGIGMREPSLVSLAGLSGCFFVYSVADRAFLETIIVPGAAHGSRILSISVLLPVFACFLAYALLYLRVGHHFPRIARVVWLFAGALLLIGTRIAYEIAYDASLLRYLIPYVGIATAVLTIGSGFVTLRHERRRAVGFLLCWIPAAVAASARLGLDLVQSAGSNPLLVNGVYIAAGVSLVMFAIAASLDLQTRERRLRAAAQASEARFRSFAGSASDSFWETDSEGRVIDRVGPASEAIGVGEKLAVALRRAVTSDPGALQAIGSAMARHQPFRGITTSFADVDGSLRYISLSGAPVTDDVGAFSGYRGIATDVTEERSRREREAQQQKMAAVGQLAGGIAHEINNLLHPIINLSRRVAGELPSRDERRRYLDIVIDAGVRAGEIVAGVLTTVRPGSPDTAVVPLDEAVRRAAEAIRPLVPDAVQFELAIVAPGGRPVGTGEALQVVTNLVGNAIYATGGAGRIGVTLEKCADDHLLVVSDDGQGMDAETRQRALEPFFTTKEVGQGTGLGLSIVYGIVRGWGGAIDIESEPGRGSRIVIRVPAGGNDMPQSMSHDRVTT